MPNCNINIKKTDPNAVTPTQGTPGSAGFDLCACIHSPVTIYPGETVLIPTGLCMEIPLGVAGLIFARSGMASKRGLAPANKVAVIDPDYRGEIFVALLNHGKVQQIVDPGERIAQMLFIPYFEPTFQQVSDLTDTQRGAGGFGSTGTSAMPQQPAPEPVPAPTPTPVPTSTPAPAPVPEQTAAPVADSDDFRDANERTADEAFALGMKYKQGDGVEKSNELAVEQFKIAADLGHVHAQLLLGSYYYMKNDCEEAAKWLQMAADLGNGEAMFNLGVFYMEGLGVDQDMEKAAEFFRRAAKRHHADARYAYADCLSQGIGVEKNEQEAFKWFKAAAEQNHVDAMYRLGQCYENGLGTEQDYEQAKIMYDSACKQGHRGATQALVMLQLKGMGDGDSIPASPEGND